MRATLLLVFFWGFPAWAVPLELSYTGQLTTGNGAPITTLSTASPLRGVRFTFWTGQCTTGITSCDGSAVKVDVTYLTAASSGAPLAVPGTFLSTCSPGGAYGITPANCLPVSLNDHGVFQVSLFLSQSDFDKAFPDTAASLWIQTELVTVNPDSGAVTGSTKLSDPAPLRQKFSVAPYCLKVPVDTRFLSYAADPGKLGIADGAIGDAQVSSARPISGSGKVLGSAVSGSINVGSGSLAASSVTSTAGTFLSSLTVGGLDVTTGVGSSGYLAQWSASTTIGTSSLFQAAGNIGVGTTTPRATLDINGFARLAKHTSAPAACDSTRVGALAMTATFRLCACNGTSWVSTADGVTGCSWQTGQAPVSTQVFGYTGGNQTFTVPAGVTVLHVKAWGAGGGAAPAVDGARNEPFGGGKGGGGGYAAAALVVSPGQVLTVLVGGHGVMSPADSLYGASGGGRSAILLSGTELLTAGGGGGASVMGGGGPGGGTSGVGAGLDRYGAGGGGGTQSSGGAAGVDTGLGDGFQGTPGLAFQGGFGNGNNNGIALLGGFGGGGAGGSGALDGYYGGGGGGGGYYGGGGGAGNWGHAGGGGSSRVPAGGLTIAGSGATQGNAFDPQCGGAGAGGVGSDGADGRVVISW